MVPLLMHLLSNFYPDCALIDMNWYLYNRVRQPLQLSESSSEPHLLDRDLAVHILRLFVNLVELGETDRVITGEEVTAVVESIMPEMLAEVNSTPNGVQQPRDFRLNYATLRENLVQVLVSLFNLELLFHFHLLMYFLGY